jgi:hypothetical protein
MKKHILRIAAALTLINGAMLLGAACAHEGPAQRTGRKLDNAAEDVKEEVND